MQSDVPCGEPHLLPGLLSRSVGLSGISIALLTAYCMLKVVVSCVSDPPHSPRTSERWIRRIPGPWEQRGLEVEYGLKQSISSCCLTERVLGPGEDAVPRPLVAVAEGSQKVSNFLYLSLHLPSCFRVVTRKETYT